MFDLDFSVLDWFVCFIGLLVLLGDFVVACCLLGWYVFEVVGL